MSLSFKLTPKEFNRLSSTHAASTPSRLLEDARLAEQLAVRVENEWGDLSPEGRELFTGFAYRMIRERKSAGGRLRLQWHRLKLAYTLLRGQEEMHAVAEYVDSMQRLIDAILLAIEDEDEAYQEKVTAALERAIHKPEMSES